ncbi:hypothetical protein JW933_06250 [candidate division FCPU426 bacterium]|nr:hypothetical protein [candidate division FCPU426 bacterium]
MWTTLYTPVGTLKYDKLNYRITHFSSLMEELIGQRFSGYVEILAPHEHGLLILYNGQVFGCFYEGTEELDLSREEIIEHFLQSETKERETIINVGELSPRIIVALSALENRPPAHRELETIFLDIPKLFATLARKHFTGTLRFYRIRNNTRLGNILLRLKKITPDQLREAIRLQLSGDKALRLGDALVQTGAIGKHDLEEALDRQTYTRKGSDLELALALFSEGEFLGGYQYNDRQLVVDTMSVFRWLGEPEILMDVIDGLLPPLVDIKSILHPGTSSKIPVKAEGPKGQDQGVDQRRAQAKTMQPRSAPEPALAARRPSPPQKKETGKKDKAALDDSMIRELTEETFMLKADDLILDIHPHPPTASTAAASGQQVSDKNLDWLDELVGQTEKARDTLPADDKLEKVADRILAEGPDQHTASELNATEVLGLPAAGVEGEMPPPPLPWSGPPAAATADAAAPDFTADGFPAAGVTAEADLKASKVRGIELIEKVLRARMGFLGMALLEREKRHFDIPAVRNMSVSQLKNINQRLFHSTSRIVGEKMAEKIMIEIDELIGR